MSERKERVAVQWFSVEAAADDESHRAVNALHRYSNAQAEMMQRVREKIGLKEEDLIVLDFLVRARRANQAVNPVDVKDGLGLSMAAVTVMTDRLDRAGYLTRYPDPADTRRRLIRATAAAEERVGGPLESIRRRVTLALTGLSEDETDTVVSFLDRAATVLDEVDAPAALVRR